jgi:hypothetical protein
MPYWHISTQEESSDDSSQSVRESHHAWAVSTGTFSSMPCILTVTKGRGIIFCDYHDLKDSIGVGTLAERFGRQRL